MIKIIQGDITTLAVDAIVNAANDKHGRTLTRAAEALDVSRNTVRKYL